MVTARQIVEGRLVAVRKVSDLDRALYEIDARSKYHSAKVKRATAISERLSIAAQVQEYKKALSLFRFLWKDAESALCKGVTGALLVDQVLL